MLSVVPAMAQVILVDNYNLAEHFDAAGMTNPAGGYGEIEPVAGPPYEYSEYPVDYFTDQGIPRVNVDTPADDPLDGTTTSLRDAIAQANASPNGAVIYFTNEAVPISLDYANGPLVIDPDTTVYFYSHNFRMTEEAGTGWPAPAGHNALLQVKGNVLFFATLNSPAYAEYPMEIIGDGKVHVYVPHITTYAYGKSPEINILDIRGDGEFKGNRAIRINTNTNQLGGGANALDLNLHDFSTFEIGQQNTIGANVVANNDSWFISNGGNTFYAYGLSDGSANILKNNLTLNGSSHAVLGYKTTIQGGLTANETSSVRLLGPSSVTGTATFGANSTVIASLGTPITPSLDVMQTVNSGPTPEVNASALLTANTIVVNDGAKLLLDSFYPTSLNVGDDYLIFTTPNPDASIIDHFTTTTVDGLPLVFSGLQNDGNNYFVTLEELNFASVFDDVTGGNKSQRSFFNYIREIAPENDLPGNVNAVLFYLADNIGTNPNFNYDSANSFLGNTYGAHDAQTFWNQKAFITQISDQLNNARNMSSGKSTFNLNATGLHNVNSQLFALRQSINSSRLGALHANGNNGVANTGIWASIYGDRVKTDGDSGLGSMGWNGSTTGFAAGYTGGGERFSWGVAAGHQKSDLDFDSLVAGAQASGELDGYNLGLYGSLNRKNSYLTGILSYGNFDNDATRTDMIGTNTSSFKSHGLAAQLEYGVHVRQTKTSDFTPYASLLWSNSDRDDITESGTGAGLSLDDSSNSILTSQLGVRYNYRMLDKNDDSLKGGLVAGVAWQHQFGDTDFPLTARFTGTEGSFTSYGTPLSGNSLQVQLGAYGRIHKNVIGFANYRGTFGNNEKVHAVTAGLGYQF